MFELTNQFPGYENWDESEMANQLMKYWSNTGEHIKVIPEVHYNNYGNRGFVDLYQTVGNIATELKSTTAVKNTTGANEIIRQFNKMKKNFNDGSKYNAEIFELLFAPSRYNINHLLSNKEMYNALIENGVRIGVLVQYEDYATFTYIGNKSNKLPWSLDKLERKITSRNNGSNWPNIADVEYLLEVLRE